MSQIQPGKKPAGTARGQNLKIQPGAKNLKYSRKSQNKVNLKVNVNKVNVKVNVNKVNDKVNDIYAIHSHYTGNHRRGAAAVRLRLLFCGRGQRPPSL